VKFLKEKEVLNLFEKWNNALLTRDPSKVAKLYAKSAVLIPTISNKIRHNHTEIQDYFQNFMSLNPDGRIIEFNIRIFNDIVVNSGIYNFYIDRNGQRVDVGARFTFVYKKFNNQWLIVEHHSSFLPE
jgi:uncharacterized protein (TIGR02246 family)